LLTSWSTASGRVAATPVGTIAFTSNRAGFFAHIYLMSATGRNQRPVVRGGGTHSDDNPAWSPSGDRIAFVRQLSGFDRDEENVFSLYVVNADGTGLRQLTPPGPDYLSRPVWSPDGREIAFDGISLANGSVGISVVDALSGTVRNLSSAARWEDSPAWSPDGRLLAFTSRPRQGVSEIWVMTPAGNERRRLVVGKGLTAPTWSPDGRSITFGSGRADFTSWFEIHAMDVDGTNRRTIASKVAYNGSHAWSPNGRDLVYSGGAVGGRYEIYKIRASGGGKRRLTRNTFLETGLGWSPDGRWVVFSSRREDNTDVYLVAADGSGERRLTKVGASDSSPTWRPR
jgi:TolB protein